MGATLEVVRTFLRELVRVVALPFHIVVYAVRQPRHRARSLAALAATGPAGQSELPRFVAALPKATRGGRPPRVFLSVGETSGETHALELLRAVEATGVRPEWSGFGGTRLQAAGVRLLDNLVDHAVMGLLAVFRKVPFFIGCLHRYLRHLDACRPDLVVVTDSPGFHMLLAEAARRRGIPVLWFITPQYWAWAPWRMRRFQRAVTGALSILPFEPRFFRPLGVPCDYIGNPLVDRMHREPLDAERVRALQAAPYVALLPGSRRREIDLNLPGLVGVLRKFRAGHPEVRVLLPHKDPRRLEQARAVLAACGGDFVEVIEGQVAEVLTGARLAVVKSGTGTLESCYLGTPTVIVYRLISRLADFSYRRLLDTPFIGGPNLVMGRAIVPEVCFLDPSGWDRVLAAMERLWPDGPARSQCLQDLKDLHARMGQPGAAERAAEWVVAALR
jgi:lipid-A-disaccharide synthase